MPSACGLKEWCGRLYPRDPEDGREIITPLLLLLGFSMPGRSWHRSLVACMCAGLMAAPALSAGKLKYQRPALCCNQLLNLNQVIML